MHCKRPAKTVCSPHQTLVGSSVLTRKRQRHPFTLRSAGRHLTDLASITVCMYSIGRSSYVATFIQISPTVPPIFPARACLVTAHLDLALTMNAPVIHDVLLRTASAHDEQPLEAAQGGYRQVIWASCFGQIVIEIIGDSIFVNGDQVEPATRCEPVHSRLFPLSQRADSLATSAITSSPVLNGTLVVSRSATTTTGVPFGVIT